MIAVLGIIAAIARMMNADKAVWMTITTTPLLNCGDKIFSSKGSDNNDINVPNATRDNVVPMNVVPVNHAGRLAKKVINCAGKFPSLLSSSSCSLLAALKLVSSTEKKIENNNETIMPKMIRAVMLFVLPEVEHKIENER